MEKEKEAIGFYLTRHPVDEFFASGKGEGCMPITELIAEEPDRYSSMQVCTVGLIRGLRTVYTKAKNEEMFLFTAEDRFNEIGCVLFPRNVAANKHRLMNGSLVKIVGEYVVDEQRGPQIIVQSVLDANGTSSTELPTVTVTIRNKGEQDELMKFARENPGTVVVQIMAAGKLYRTARCIKLTPAAMDFLQSHFVKVET